VPDIVSAKQRTHRDLALFDFDGTVTFSDTFTPFVLRTAGKRRMAIALAALAPLFTAYKIGLASTKRMRMAAMLFAFRGRNEEEIRRLGAKYAREKLTSVARPQALERIAWHLSRGDEVAVVSASLDVYLSHWCRDQGLNLLCNTLEAKDGVFTGRCVGGDCSGPEKARRVRQTYDLDTFNVIYAYGDTAEDEELLALADRRYLCWRELTDGGRRAKTEGKPDELPQ